MVFMKVRQRTLFAEPSHASDTFPALLHGTGLTGGEMRPTAHADREYERYVSKKMNDAGPNFRKGICKENDASSSSTDPNPIDFAPNRDMDNELLGITLQNWLTRTSWNLLRAEPIYSKYGVIEVGGIDYTSFSVNFNSKVIGFETCSVGRFAKGEFLAREDAALFMLRCLLAWTNREIVDFNYFNMQDLQVQNAVLEAQNVDLIVENEKLKNEIKMLRRKYNFR
ncbi:hypothetical protein RIF29_21543 [Crotalaria pallida]|uniref:Uncharacterized protein n=1 Tax=Crotalaria pallida TaxID=3830 RepID=A0AAN9F4Y1_CROPI